MRTEAWKQSAKGNRSASRNWQANAEDARDELNRSMRRIADLERAAIGFTCGQLAGMEKPFLGGCGEHVPAYDAYRCADCTASFHRECIGQHFELDDAVKNIRAKECWRKDCSEKLAELTRLTALLEDRPKLAEELMKHGLVGLREVTAAAMSGDAQSYGNTPSLAYQLTKQSALALADRLIAYLKPLG